jgi:hypothetical protein
MLDVCYPGLAVFIVVLCINIFGDGLRDALEPMTRRCLLEIKQDCPKKYAPLNQQKEEAVRWRQPLCFYYSND